MADKIIEVPGVGNIAFPATMSDSDIGTEIQKLSAPKSVGGFMSNVMDSGKKFVTDTVDALRHPINTLDAITDIPLGLGDKAMQAAGIVSPPAAGTPGEQSIKTVDAMLDHFKGRYGSFDKAKEALYQDPVGVMADVSTLFSGAGEVAEAGNLTRTARVARTAADVTNPIKVATKAGTGLVRATGKLADPAAAAVSTNLTRGALRGGFTTVTPEETVTRAAEAANAGSVPFSKAGLQQVTDAISDLQKQKVSLTGRGTAAGKTIDPKSIVFDLEKLRDHYEVQAFPPKDMKQIDDVIADFKSRHKGPISVDEAEALKEGTYSNNKYGAKAPPHMAATEAAEKTVARVLKEELEKQIPELSDLNASQKKLLDLRGILKPAVNKYLNSGGFTGHLKKELFTKEGAVKTAAIAGTSGYVSGNPALGGGIAAVQAVLSDPRVKQRIAVMINQARKNNPARWGTPGMKAATARAASLATALSRVSETEE